MGDLCRRAEPDRGLRKRSGREAGLRAARGLVLAAGIAEAARRMRALSTSGTVAAALIGSAVYAGMGTRGSAAMVAYFASSSALSRLHGQRSPLQQRGSRRDAVQVLANGGPAAVLALLHLSQLPAPADAAISAFYGSLAAAAADTWATEIGTRWGGQPRSLVTGRRAPPGESGAVTPAGLAASVAASLIFSALVPPAGGGRRDRAIACAVGGIAGSLSDSLLGGLVQERRWCDCCGSGTEMTIHTCGCRTRHLSGLRVITNDSVNVAGIVVGGVTSAAIFSARAKLTARNGSRVEFIHTVNSSRVQGQIGAP